MSKLIRILIADDHPIVRAGMRALIERHANFRVVAEASNGEEAVARVLELQPDVAVLDIRMPGISGIETCRQITNTVPGCRVLMLTSYAEDDLLLAAIQAGASEYLLKRIGDGELVRAIERVSTGEDTLDPARAAKVFNDIQNTRAVQRPNRFDDLSHQEVAVLALIAQGLTNRQIAEEMHLSEGTIRNYVSNILAKIDVVNRAEAAAYAVKHSISEVVPPRH
jgi:two-component system, NarL family, response regulator DevR